MSWIIRKLRDNIALEKPALESLIQSEDLYRAYSLANSIAQSTGRSFGVEMSLNFPAGKTMPKDPSLIGSKNIGVTVAKGRKMFEGVTAEMVQREAAKIADGVRFEPAARGYEGFHAITYEGRVTVLPGAVYVWLTVDRRVEAFLDWLFINAYGLVPSAE